MFVAVGDSTGAVGDEAVVVESFRREIDGGVADFEAFVFTFSFFAHKPSLPYEVVGPYSK